MSFRRLKFTGFTDRRRRQLAKKVDRLERLETRNTITEPISVTGLALSAITGASRLGLIPAFGASNALNGLRPPAAVAKQAARKGSITIPFRGNLLKPIPSVESKQGAGGSSKADRRSPGPG